MRWLVLVLLLLAGCHCPKCGGDGWRIRRITMPDGNPGTIAEACPDCGKAVGLVCPCRGMNNDCPKCGGTGVIW